MLPSFFNAPIKLQLSDWSLEETLTHSPGLRVIIPSIGGGVELILAKRPYMYRDIAWDCLSFFTFKGKGSFKT